jgi:hypothetical protein
MAQPCVLVAGFVVLRWGAGVSDVVCVLEFDTCGSQQLHQLHPFPPAHTHMVQQHIAAAVLQQQAAAGVLDAALLRGAV